MTAQAETWSEEDLERRFAVGEPYDELTRLAATLDRLLARLAASLRHERQFSAAMSHELRTPLAKLMAEAELALRRTRSESEYRESLEAVLGNAEQIERIVETLLSTARQEFPRGVANAREIAEAVVAAYSDDALSRGVELDLELSDSSERMRVGVDQDIAERILYPVVENALRYSRTSVRVGLRGTDRLAFADGWCRMSTRQSSSPPSAAARAARPITEPASGSRCHGGLPGPSPVTSRCTREQAVTLWCGFRRPDARLSRA
jgi:signal transduction histidine kinase